MTTLWTVAADRSLRPLRVRTGISDGQRTVVTGPGITAGMQVIIGTASATTAAGASPSPFQSTSSQGRAPRAGF